MLTLYYLIYCTAWLAGIFRSPASLSKGQTAGIRITATSFACLVVFYILISGVQMGALIFAAIPLYILYPLFLIGLGLAISTTAKTLYLKGLRNTAVVLGMVPLIVPLAALLMVLDNKRSIATQNQSELAQFQAGTVSGQLGDASVQFPASPQVETIHACPTYHNCYTKFRRHGEDLRKAQKDTAGATPFKRIELNPTHETCTGPTAPLNDCLPLSEQAAWCATRDDIAESIWCRASPRHKVVFSSSDYRDYSLRDGPEWVKEPLHSLGLDALNVPVEIECNTTRDSRLERNPNSSRYCRFGYHVSEQAVATVFLDKFSADELKTQADEMFRYANEMWGSILQE